MTASATQERSGDSETPRVTALDQWRGLALVLVLVAHAFHESGRVDGLGRVGVNLFFFISGILVFRSLARSRSPGWGRAKSFWWRRLRRLYPALIAYVLVMTIGEYWLQHLPGQHAGCDYASFLKSVPSALFYYVNYRRNVLPSLGHLWSVSCEMQFYLLAPLLFACGGGQRGGGRVYAVALALLMGLGLLHPFLPEAWSPHKYEFQFAVWPMMLGFCCEYWRDWLDHLPAHWRLICFRLVLAVCLAGSPIMFLGHQMKAPTVALGALLLVPCLLAYADGWPFPQPAGLAGKAHLFHLSLAADFYDLFLSADPVVAAGRRGFGVRWRGMVSLF
jgi:peptidoglycan/LPS O-acetylase OafA/YrhL